MKRFLLATALAAFSAGIASADGHAVTRLGTEGAYPPYNFIDDNGKPAGFDIEVGDEVCERADLDCTWVINDWDSIIPNLVSSNYDAILAGMSITEEREKVIDFTINYAPADPSAYVGLADDVDVAKGVIAAQTGTLQASYVADSGADLVEFPTPEDTLAAVRNGEVDAVLADKGYLVTFVEESGGELMFIGEDVILGKGFGIGVRKSDTALKEKMDAALQSMKDDGTLNAMIKKWLPNSALF